jgi:hypothetical protein
MSPRACSVGHSMFERVRLVRAYYVCRTNLDPSRYDVGCDFQMFARSCWMLRSRESMFRALSTFVFERRRRPGRVQAQTLNRPSDRVSRRFFVPFVVLFVLPSRPLLNVAFASMVRPRTASLVQSNLAPPPKRTSRAPLAFGMTLTDRDDGGGVTIGRSDVLCTQLTGSPNLNVFFLRFRLPTY